MEPAVGKATGWSPVGKVGSGVRAGKCLSTPGSMQVLSYQKSEH